MVFKLDPVALVLDTFTFGIWSGYWNIQRITEYKYPNNIRGIIYDEIGTGRNCPIKRIEREG